MRGCSNCNYSAELWLPDIQKKIIYVDQCFFSSALRGSDKRFSRIIDKLKHLSDFQLIAMPFSSVHEDESYHWGGYDGITKERLLEFIKDTACGHKFLPTYEVEKTQLINSFKKFLADNQPDHSVFEKDAIEGNIHEWQDYIRIDVNYRHNDIDLKRELKKQAVDLLLNRIEQWRKSTKSFNENVELETHDIGEDYIQSFLAYSRQVANGDISVLLTTPIRSTIVQTLMLYTDNKDSTQKRYGVVVDFFKSNHFKCVPFVWIKARLFSQLKHIIKSGAYTNQKVARKRLSGTFYDFSYIATYAPYCDAILVDQSMAELAAAPAVGLEKRFDVNIFSLNDKSLFDWLNSLEENMTQDHTAGLIRAYPNLSKK